MGGPMASNLISSGFEVIGYNRSPEKAKKLLALGGKVALSAREAAGGADVVITMLPDSEAVESVALGPDGVMAALAPGSLFIDMSTIHPSSAQTVADVGGDLGISVLDAPVSGGEQGAKDRTLSIMVGGTEDAFEAARPIFESLGSTVILVGTHGAGQTVKAANQLIVAGVLQLVSEALVFLDAYGVDPERAIQVLAGGLASNAILTRKAPAMLARDFSPGFRVSLHHKDLGIVAQTASEAGIVLPVGQLLTEVMNSMLEQGYGHLDHSALLLNVERLAGKRADLNWPTQTLQLERTNPQ